MAVTAFWYGKGLEGQYGTTAARRVDWVTDTVKVALTTSSYTPDQDTHEFFDDVTNEVTGTGYTAGGQALTGKSVSYDATSNELRLDAADPSWSASTITARRAVIYKDTGTASTSPLLGWIDFGADASSTASTLTISFDTTGVLKIVAA